MFLINPAFQDSIHFTVHELVPKETMKVRDEHADKFQNLVNDAVEKGIEIIGRGSFGHLGEDVVGQFFPPTVVVNVNHTMKLMQEEDFGPIISIIKFSSDEVVVKLANDSNYGLGCAVFSGN